MTNTFKRLLSSKVLIILTLLFQITVVVSFLSRYINVEINGTQKVIPVVARESYRCLLLEPFISRAAYNYPAIFGTRQWSHWYTYPLAEDVYYGFFEFEETGLTPLNTTGDNYFRKGFPAELLIKTDGQNVIIQDLLIANQPLNEFIKAHMLKKGETP